MKGRAPRTAAHIIYMGVLAGPAFAGDPVPVGQAREEVIVTTPALHVGAGRSEFAIGSGVPLQEIPVSAEILTRDFIDNAHYHDLAGLISGYSLATSTRGDGSLFDQIVLRGFEDSPFYRDGFSDALGQLPVRDTANVESVEILKGPASALHGPGEPGGSINIETKKPGAEAFHAVQAGLGSYDRYRLEADSTGSLDTRGSLAYRMVGAMEDAGSHRDFMDSRRLFAAPSLAWIPVERLRLLAAVEYIEHRSPYDTGTIAIDGGFPLDRDLFLGEPSIEDTRISGLTGTLSGEFDMGGQWTLSSLLYWQKTEIEAPRVEPVEVGFDQDEGATVLSRQLLEDAEDNRVYAAQVELEGDLDTGPLGHRILLGYEYSNGREEVRIDESDEEEDDFAIDPFDIRYGQPLPALFPGVDVTERIRLNSVYVQDFISLGDHWRLLLGTRYDMIDIEGDERVSGSRFRQEDDRFSSRAGIVYALNPNLSLYGSYAEALDPNEGLRPDGSPLDPTRSKAVEAGVKVLHPFLNTTLTASVYRIKQTDVATDAPDAPGFEIQTAEQRSKGLDIELLVSPRDWMQLGLKYGYNDAEIRGDTEIPDGITPLNAPRHRLVLFGLFSFSLRAADDLQAGVNFNYSSKRQASLDVEELGPKLPGFSTTSLFMNYALSPHLRLGLDVRNLFDERYLAASQSDLLHITPGVPLSVFANLEVHF